jgi:hypothetical protein
MSRLARRGWRPAGGGGMMGARAPVPEANDESLATAALPAARRRVRQRRTGSVLTRGGKMAAPERRRTLRTMLLGIIGSLLALAGLLGGLQGCGAPGASVVDASLSPDGTTIGLWVVDDQSSRYVFYDLASESVVATTPSSWRAEQLVWGPRHSYLLLARPGSGPLGLYWFGDLHKAPTLLLEGDGRFAPEHLYDWGDFAVDPTGRTAVFVFFLDLPTVGETWATYAAPLGGGKSRLVEASPFASMMAAVVADPEEPGNALALLAGMRPQGDQLRLAAYSCETGKRRWRAATPPLAGKSMLVKAFVPYDDHRGLLAEGVQPAVPSKPTLNSSPTPVSTRLWQVDLRDGTLTPAAELADAVFHLQGLPTSKGGPRFLVLTGHDVWMLELRRGGSQFSRLTAGGNAVPVGAVLDTNNALQIYYTTESWLWRCRMDQAKVERVWGVTSPDTTERPPQVLRGTAAPRPAAERRPAP